MIVNHSRKKLVVDRESQFGVARGITLVWIGGTLLIASFPILVMTVYGIFLAMKPMDEVLSHVLEAAIYPAVMGLLMVPVCILYSIRFSNRISGPVFRVNRELMRLVGGEPTSEIHLRDTDYFRHLGDTFNAIREKILMLEERLRELEYARAREQDPSAGASRSCKGGSAIPLSVLDAGASGSLPQASTSPVL